MSSEKHTCPRRADHFSPDRNETGVDSWRDDGTCSYCGSLSGDAFMCLAEAKAELGPTDKNYKVYVGSRSKFYFQHLSDEQRQRFVELLNQSGALNIGQPGRFYRLPFFVTRA